MKTNLSPIFKTARRIAGRWFITTMLLSAAGSLVAQTDKQVWVQRFGTTFGSQELARSIATDSAGNAVVAGDSDEGGLGLGILVIKYSPAGEALWTNRFNTSGEDRAAAVAVDGSGNVFVTGSSGNGAQHVTLAFSSLGIPLWTNQFNGPGGWSYTEGPSALAVDDDGNVFVTGRSQVDGSVAFATLKYSPSGVPLWTNLFVGNGGNAPSALAVDNAGNVVVRGGTHLIKYASDGVPMWTNGCPGAGFLLDIRGSLGVDGTGNVFLLGQSDDAGNFPNNLLVKYSSDGTALWTNSFPGAYGQSLAVDPAGNVAVTGASLGAFFRSGIRTIKYSADGTLVWLNEYDADFPNLPFVTVVAASNGDIFVSAHSSGSDDQVTIKYSAAGSALWTNHAYTSLEDGEDYPRPHPALAIDPSGNALVTGYFFNDYTLDFATHKYANDGAEVWARFHDGIVSDTDSPSAVAVDSSGNIIVTGGGRHDYATIKYSPSGVPLWTNYYDGPAHAWDSATALAVASNGNIFVTGGSYPGTYEDVSGFWLTIAYTGDGVPLWTNACPNFEHPVAIATDHNGDVIVSGVQDIFWDEGGWATIKYSGAGVPLWTNRHSSGFWDDQGFVQGLAVGGQGDVVVVGSSAEYWAVIKYSSSGSALWTNLYNGSVNQFARANAVAIGTNGDIFVTGTGSEADSSAGNDLVTIKYSATGLPLWTNRYDGPGMFFNSAKALALDGSGNVVVLGSSTAGGGDLVTIKYSSDGTALWTNRYGGPGTQWDVPSALAVDGNGNVFVTGGDSTTVAYSSGGVPLWTNRYDGPATAYDLAVIGIGEVVVVARSLGDYATVKYDSGFALDITSSPSNRTNNPGTTATFSVGVSGTGPFTFQWQRNGMNLVNGGNVSGATTSNLTLTAVITNDAGNYTVVISNPAGSVTSVVATLSVILPDPPPGPSFTNVTAAVVPGLTHIGFGSVAWGDYDNDGRLDFLLTGDYSTDEDGTFVASQLWRNTASGFTNVTASVAPGLPTVDQSSVAWGDYDNDGRLDLFITGSYTSQIWRNTGGSFTNVTATVAPGLPGVQGSSVAWGDYDNDGRLDFLLTGFRYGPNWSRIYVAQLWRNTGSGFTDVTATLAPGLPGVFWGSVAWGDYDNDGRLDFLLTGVTHYESVPESDSESIIDSVSQVWRNTGSGFSNVTASVAPGLPAVSNSIVALTPAGYNSSVAWGDYDNDGRLDFLLTGSGYSQLWRNTGSGFTNVTAAVASGLPGLEYSSVSWGDYDNDGRLDFLLTGFWAYPTNRYVSQLWRNTSSGFTNVTASAVPGLAAVADASVAWADYDNDGRLDFLLSGALDLGCDVCNPHVVCQLWRNDTLVTNTPPSAPTGLAMTASSNAVMLSWNSATDDHTPASGLTYNVRAGTTPGGNNLLSAHVNETNGFRRVPAMGNAMLRHSLPLTGLTNGQPVYWSVQAVDTAFVGGPFASEMSGVSLPQPVFENVSATAAPGLPGVSGRSAVAWGDYDNDGRLDLFIAGYIYDEEGDFSISQIWRNTGNGFTNVTTTVAPDLPGIDRASAAWGDYDNDGRLDLLICGNDGSHAGISQIWRNTGDRFTNVTASVAPGLQGGYLGVVAWGDYDNDGRLDFFITGIDDDDAIKSQIWRNTGSGFSNVTTTVAPGLPQAARGSVTWADFDNDGWLDFFLTGTTGSDYDSVSQLWRNTGTAFTNVTATLAPGLTPVHFSSVAWADYDNDGRLDFLLTGYNFDYTNRGRYYAEVWRNTGEGFTNVTAAVVPGLPGIASGAAAWGDYDNDGRLDFMVTGHSYFNDIHTHLWRNTGNGFENVTATAAPGLPPAWLGSLAWVDFDSDGRLDFLLTGNAEVAGPDGFVSQLWRNNTPITNTPPSAPTGLAMTATADSVMLSWNSATDGQTPASGLSYNVRAGSTPGGNNLLSAHVNETNGFRRVPAMGNAMLRHSLPLTGLTNGETVFWSVQAVDTAFAGGPFASEMSGGSLPQPVFENVTATVAPGLPALFEPIVAWGDYDNDGGLDFLLTGYFYDDEDSEISVSQLWRNTGSTFTNVTATVAPGLPGITRGSVSWGDYNNDGWPDLLITGQPGTSIGPGISQIWRNTGSGFTNVTATVAPGLPQLGYSSAAWGDYDNDGRLDFLLTGSDDGAQNSDISQVWRNTGSGFANVTATVAPGLPAVSYSTVVWGDYDNDGRLDFLIMGFGTQQFFQLWRNTGKAFTNVTTTVAPGLPQVEGRSIAWGDYDNDGWLDFLFTGFGEGDVFTSQLWRNTGNGFTNVTAAVAPDLSRVSSSSVAWGDYDNDGRLDFLLSGLFYTNGGIGFVCELWRNTGTGFTNVTASAAPGLSAVYNSPVVWGDYDNDGRLDFFAGRSQLWRNNTPITNTPPSAPTGLAMTASSNAVMLSWNSATDGQTPASGLSYNVRAGTTPGGNNLLSAHVNATTGFRRVPAMGNAMLRHSLPLTGLINGQTVYWSVQAVDTSFAGGPFATETSVVSLPQLRITRPDATNAVVSWSPPTFGWVLQHRPQLNMSNWNTAASGGANPVTLPATNAAQFYRLSKP